MEENYLVIQIGVVKESKGFIDDLYKCNCIAQLVDLNEKFIAE